MVPSPIPIASRPSGSDRIPPAAHGSRPTSNAASFLLVAEFQTVRTFPFPGQRAGPRLSRKLLSSLSGRHRQIVSFLPEPGAPYRGLFAVHGSKCKSSVFELHQSSHLVRRTYFTLSHGDFSLTARKIQYFDRSVLVARGEPAIAHGRKPLDPAIVDFKGLLDSAGGDIPHDYTSVRGSTDPAVPSTAILSREPGASAKLISTVPARKFQILTLPFLRRLQVFRPAAQQLPRPGYHDPRSSPPSESIGSRSSLCYRGTRKQAGHPVKAPVVPQRPDVLRVSRLARQACLWAALIAVLPSIRRPLSSEDVK